MVGIDLSRRMIEQARRHPAGRERIEYRLGDLRQVRRGDGGYDVVASIATLHHLPLGDALECAASLVAPGGVLLVIDLYRTAGVLWLPENAVSWLRARWLRRGPQPSPALDRAWREHGRHDRYPTMGEVRRLAARAVPGAVVRKDLLWRWTLIWRAPAS